MSAPQPVHILFDLRTLGTLTPPARVYLLALVDGLLPALLEGNRATVALPPDEPFPLQRIEHPNIAYRTLAHPARSRQGAHELAALVRETRPGVYWGADPTVAVPATPWRRRRLRVVYAFQTLTRPSTNGLIRWVARSWRQLTVYRRILLADALVCPSHALAVRLVARLGLRARRRARVIRNGVHPLFRRHTEEEILAARRAWLVPRRYVMMAGHSVFAKDLAVPLRALGQNEEVSSVTCVIVGDARLPAALRETIRDCHLEGMVRFIDVAAISLEALSALYSGAVATFEPANGAEYRPAILRSMACGTPVICGADAANNELYGNAALRVHPTDPTEWSRAFVSLSLSAPLRERLTARGEACAAERSWGAAARATYGVARELVAIP